MTILKTGTRAEHAQRPEVRWLLQVAAVAVGIVALCTLTAYGVAALSTEVHGARTDLIYELNERVQSQTQADRLLATQMVVLRSRAILAPVAQAAGVPLEDLEEQTDVELLDDSQIIRVTVGDPDPQQALTLTEMIGEEYVEFVARANEQQLTEQTELLQGELEALRDERATIEQRLTEVSSQRSPADPLTAEERRLELELQDVLEAINDRESQQVALRVAAAESPAARALTSPYILEDPVAPRPLRAVAAGMLVGLILAALLVVLLYRFRRPRT